MTETVRTLIVYATAAIMLLLGIYELFHLIDTGKIAGEVGIPIIVTLITAPLAFLFGQQGNREAVHLSNSTPGAVQVGPDNASVTVTAPDPGAPA